MITETQEQTSPDIPQTINASLGLPSDTEHKFFRFVPVRDPTDPCALPHQVEGILDPSIGIDTRRKDWLELRGQGEIDYLTFVYLGLLLHAQELEIQLSLDANDLVQPLLDAITSERAEASFGFGLSGGDPPYSATTQVNQIQSKIEEALGTEQNFVHLLFATQAIGYKGSRPSPTTVWWNTLNDDVIAAELPPKLVGALYLDMIASQAFNRISSVALDRPKQYLTQVSTKTYWTSLLFGRYYGRGNDVPDHLKGKQSLAGLLFCMGYLKRVLPPLKAALLQYYGTAEEDANIEGIAFVAIHIWRLIVRMNTRVVKQAIRRTATFRKPPLSALHFMQDAERPGCLRVPILSALSSGERLSFAWKCINFINSRVPHISSEKPGAFNPNDLSWIGI